eukprot:96051-Rhodomonas_salina.1
MELATPPSQRVGVGLSGWSGLVKAASCVGHADSLAVRCVHTRHARGYPACIFRQGDVPGLSRTLEPCASDAQESSQC